MKTIIDLTQCPTCGTHHVFDNLRRGPYCSEKCLAPATKAKQDRYLEDKKRSEKTSTFSIYV